MKWAIFIALFFEVMEKFNFEEKQNVYFIGIGGISMSAIAIILNNNGFFVSGSDIFENEEVKKLESLGIKVNIGHKAKNINDEIDIVVYSKAIHDDNEEIKEAKKRNIKLMSRSEILGGIMANYEKRICIAGTHGKTTTTSLISKVLYNSGVDPTINIGGVVEDFGGNSYIGKNKNMFIAEACEYTNSFLDFCPSIAVITNIEEDHLDFFKDLNDIRNSFKKFIELLPDDGTLVINKKISDINYLTNNIKAKVITYGDDDSADYYFENVRYDASCYQIFDVIEKGKCVGEMRIKLIGNHNVLNFIAAFATLRLFGFSLEEIRKCLENFNGAKRRLELKGNINGVIYMDDYAHHPTEIEASYNALKQLKYNNLYVIFQPHTFSRTKILFNDFVRVLSKFDNIIFAKIYPARELDDGTISSLDLVKGIKKYKNSNMNICEYFEKFEDIQEYISKTAKAGDVVVTMGAGDVYKIYDLIQNSFSKGNAD